MTLFFTLLPIYLLGNLHCLGMCGPLVFMLGQHKYRNYYFLGRLSGFALAGFLAGSLGKVLNLVLHRYHLLALTSFIIGVIILILGVFLLIGRNYPGQEWLAKRLEKVNRHLTGLILKDRRWPTFLFGFFTISLPCGQTLIVFSAIALVGESWTGAWNGAAFALLTSPSLWFAMHAHRIFKRFKGYYNKILGICSLFIGVLTVCRGFAELDLIDHFVLNPDHSTRYHIVLY